MIHNHKTLALPHHITPLSYCFEFLWLKKKKRKKYKERAGLTTPSEPKHIILFFKMLLYFCLEIFNILDSICKINLLTFLPTEIKARVPNTGEDLNRIKLTLAWKCFEELWSEYIPETEIYHLKENNIHQYISRCKSFLAVDGATLLNSYTAYSIWCL